MTGVSPSRSHVGQPAAQGRVVAHRTSSARRKLTQFFCYAEHESAYFVQEYYGQLRENNWSLYTDFKGFVGARYDL